MIRIVLLSCLYIATTMQKCNSLQNLEQTLYISLHITLDIVDRHACNYSQIQSSCSIHQMELLQSSVLSDSLDWDWQNKKSGMKLP